MNLEKSEVIPIGTQKLKDIILPKCISKLTVNRTFFKTLGIYYTYETNESVRLNFEPKINAMKTVINIWSARKLSLKGKVLIIKTLLLPQINYLLASIYTPNNILVEIDKLLFQFLWNKKTPKVKKSCIISNYRDGGLKMPDVFSTNTVSKVKWIQKLLKLKYNEKWEHLFLQLFTIGKSNLNKKLPDNFRNKCLTNFHKQVFDCWNTFYCKEANTVDEIFNEYVFNNKFIISDDKPLQLHQFKITDTNLKDLVLQEIVQDNGHFYSLNQINDKYNTKLDELRYNRILSAIPNTWKTIIKHEKKTKFKVSKNPAILYKGRYTEVTKINSKVLYWMIASNNSQEATSLEKWIESYPFLETAPWQKIFKGIHLISNEPYLQSFQYKIVHRILNCNKNLYNWKIKESPECIYCNDIDSIEHHLFYCKNARLLWKDIYKLLNRIFKPNLKEPGVCEIIFGVHIDEISNSAENYCRNLVILIGKWYINHMRSEGKDFHFTEFCSILKHKIDIYLTNFKCPKSLERVDGSIQNSLTMLLNKI